MIERELVISSKLGLHARARAKLLQVVAGYRAGPADGINSLHADRLAGRPMEIDARNGVIVRRGAVHGIATPVNAMVAALLEAAGS